MNFPGVDAFHRAQRLFAGWAGGFSTYAYGLFVSYLIFVTFFGSLYSISNLLQLTAQSVPFPTALLTLLLLFYIISFFAIPLGMAFRIVWEKRRDSNVRETATGIIIIAALLGLRTANLYVYASIVVFSVILIWLLWSESRFFGEGKHKPFSFSKAMATLYCIFVAGLFVAISPPLTNYTTIGDLLFNYLPGPLFTIQALSLLLTLIATPVAWILASGQRPRTIWFAFTGLALLSIITVARGLYFEGGVLILLTALLYYRYDSETLQSFGEYSTLNPSALSSTPNSEAARPTEPLQTISASLNRLAEEAQFLREERTGEILRVHRHENYVIRLERIVEIDGFEKPVGINHYLVSSRTGHGKTTLVRNLVTLNSDYGFLILDRHDEYDGQIFQFDKKFELDTFEAILEQIPASKLSSGPNMLREAQLFNLEQQFDRLVEDALDVKMVEELFSQLHRTGRIILRPGKFPDFVYTRLSHEIINKIFEISKRMKREQEARLRIVIVNEEAQNSFNVDENGEELDKSHPLLKVIHEGRKYGVAVVNITSNPENIPRTVKDNSLIVLGSIGTPAIKRLVGEKLGMLYVRYIYELPVGYFFLDSVDEEGNYIVFPDHFGRRELIDGIKA